MGFLQEWTGYHLLKDQRYQRFVILLGDRDNGKSTYLHALTYLLGPENVSHQSLYNLTTRRFSVAELYTRLANIAADIGPDEIKYTGALKIATGEDIGSSEKKYKDPFDFMSYAKLTFSCNQLPVTPDETGAFHKRHIVLLFNVTIPLAEQDKTLKQKLVTPKELSGILNWALEGLHRLLIRDQFNEPTTIEERRTQYRRLSNPILAFAEDCLIEDPDEYETKDNIYKAFAQYCKVTGFVAPSDSTFFKELKKHMYYQAGSKTINKQRVKVLNGVKLEEAARCARGTRGVLPKDLLQYSSKVVIPRAGRAPRADIEASQKPEDPLVLGDQLFTDAIEILSDHGGRMLQRDLFARLVALGYEGLPSRLALHEDDRFAFMGMNVKLRKQPEEETTS
jgi:P4 family phage/plasmid primase-like protien